MADSWPTTKAQNLQIELATTLLLVNALGDKMPILLVKDFLASNKTLFQGIGDKPLFTKMSGGKGLASRGLVLNQPLATMSLDRVLQRVYAQVGPAGSGAYHFCFKKGNKICILYGADAQANALQHTSNNEGQQIRYKHYSSGLQTIPVSRTMIEETPDKVQRLAQAGYYN